MIFVDKALQDFSYGEGFLYAVERGLRENPEIRNELDKYPVRSSWRIMYANQ